MSGPVANNIFRSSGVIAAAAGGLSWQPVVTASTLSASAGNGYWINTTSNACTITLPGSAEAGDQIIFVDYARTWGTNAIIIDSNGLNYQGQPDTFTVDYDTSGQALNLVYSGATIGWTPSSDIVNADEPSPPPTQRAIFAYGNDASSDVLISNLVNSSGTVASNTSITGTAREYTQGAEYGGDKGIITYTNAADVTNLVSNQGVVAANTTGVGTNRNNPAATKYGLDKAIFGYGYTSSNVSLTNLVSNTGVVGNDVTGVGTARRNACGTGFGLTGQAIFGYGYSNEYSRVLNLVSSAGVVASDTTSAGSGCPGRGAAMYGSTGQAIFAFGETSGGITAISNLCTNTGVVGSDVSAIGQARVYGAMSAYGGDKAIFAFGSITSSASNISNKINNVGVVASNTSGVGSARSGLAGLGYSTSA